MEYEDKTIHCIDCKTEFIWTAGDQSFLQGLLEDGKLDYVDRMTKQKVEGSIKPPLRCRDCRDARKALRDQREGRTY